MTISNDFNGQTDWNINGANAVDYHQENKQTTIRQKIVEILMRFHLNPRLLINTRFCMPIAVTDNWHNPDSNVLFATNIY